ncbi:hypothetical protein ACEQ8H_008748, partial [Pleosporales sp. CAS-2024a]
LQRYGIIFDDFNATTLITAESKAMCQALLSVDELAPAYNFCSEDTFMRMCHRAVKCNEERVRRDLTPHIVPSAELLYVLNQETALENIKEEISADWSKCNLLGGTRPRPDYAYGLSFTTFTEEELAKLQNYTNLDNPTKFTESMYFPFLLCEAKCGTTNIDDADRQNAHSASIAVNAIVRLCRAAGEQSAQKLSGHVLVFSVSHNNESVRVYGHFPIIRDDSDVSVIEDETQGELLLMKQQMAKIEQMYKAQLEELKEESRKQMEQQKEDSRKQMEQQKEDSRKQMEQQKEHSQKQIAILEKVLDNVNSDKVLDSPGYCKSSSNSTSEPRTSIINLDHLSRANLRADSRMQNVHDDDILKKFVVAKDLTRMVFDLAHGEIKYLMLTDTRLRPQKRAYQALYIGLACVLAGCWVLSRHYIISQNTSQWDHDSNTLAQSGPQCPQVEPLVPVKSSKELDDMQTYLESEDFKKVAIERLSGAVQVPTQSYDDMGEIGEDERWDIFYDFAVYLEKTFPLVHAKLQLEKINTHGLLYTWVGKDASLKPNLLMAHQDVVPVPESTVKSWTHPPFDGYFDGTFVWGRGASDCKNQLIGILSAVEALISAKFEPQRTLILSFGFDEEISGGQGAHHLADYLIKKLGHNSIAAIVDEGAVNIESWGANFAVPGVGEKGYVDVDIVVRMPGGHSSIPPAHNGIGVASEVITQIEANPYEPQLYDENPYLGLLQCGAEHAPKFPKKLRKLLSKRSSKSKKWANMDKKDALAMEAAKAGPGIKYLFTSSVAVDIIHGGVKNNALPERTQMTVNHRVNVGSSTEVIKSHIASIAAGVARKYNLTLNAYNATETPSSITLAVKHITVEPAPVTPTTLHAYPKSTRFTPYHVLSGTTRALYGQDLIVSPGIMTGNTDTRYYWNLSEHIFRYGPGWDQEQEGLGNIHTVDEKMGVKAHIDTTKWMWSWIRNMDEAAL